MNHPEVELSVHSLEAGLTADSLEVERIELCSGGLLGGLTPSAGLLREVLTHVQHAEVHVLIRPREGGFHYRADEVDVMLADVAHARLSGASGVVIGALNAKGEVDARVVADLVTAAADRQVTFHRAFDLCAEPLASVHRLAELGVDRILTSGQANTAEEGAGMLVEPTRAASGVDIMACGGIRAHNAAHVLRATGVPALHAAPTKTVSADKTTVDYGEHREFDRVAASQLVQAVREFRWDRQT